MKEPDRIARNKARLAECHPVFAAKVERVIADMLKRGYRCRIQDGYRSPAAQLEAARTGHSKLRWGFHCATSPTGRPEAMAVDLLDDDAPLAPSTPYLLTLAHVAQTAGNLRTGILWGLPNSLMLATAAAVLSGNFKAPVRVGWDPTHLEWFGISVADAKAGKRPTIKEVA